LVIPGDANAINGEQKRLDCSDSFSRPGSRPNIQRKFGRFWKFVRAFTPNLRRKAHTEFTKTVRGDSPLEQLSSRSMILLLNVRGNCSCFREKAAHMVGHLPPQASGAGFQFSTETNSVGRLSGSTIFLSSSDKG